MARHIHYVVHCDVSLAIVYRDSLLLIGSFPSATLVVWKSGNAICNGTGFWVTILASESYLELQVAYLGWKQAFWSQIVGNITCVVSKTRKTEKLTESSVGWTAAYFGLHQVWWLIPPSAR